MYVKNHTLADHYLESSIVFEQNLSYHILNIFRLSIKTTKIFVYISSPALKYANGLLNST